MRIYLSDQKNHLTGHLERLRSKPVMTYDPLQLKEKISIIELDLNTPFDRLDISFLFSYKIFPKHIMAYLTEWGHEKRNMTVGDTIVQQAYLPPTRTFSQKIIFGVRIKDVIDSNDKKGFSYETLEGHVEKGISTFTVERHGDRNIFKIHTLSIPGNVLTRLVGPIFSVPYQAYCTRAALQNVKQHLEAEGRQPADEKEQAPLARG